MDGRTGRSRVFTGSLMGGRAKPLEIIWLKVVVIRVRRLHR